MKAEARRNQILTILTDKPVSASALAKTLGVSRQIIVGDIAIMRASGKDILATPKGYIMNDLPNDGFITATIACSHCGEMTREEIYTIVDNGGTLVNVIVEHPIYGQLTGELHISSRFDADSFFKKVEEDEIVLLSALTDGIHLHTLKCRTKDDLNRIINALREKNILFETENDS